MKKISAEKQKLVQTLRKNGLSHRDIAQQLKISLGTTFHYGKTVRLTSQQHQKLMLRTYAKGIGLYTPTERKRISTKGGLLSRKNYISPHSKEKLIELIQQFAQAKERIPTKREFVNYYRPILLYFGTWNKAIEEAGFSPNPVLFAKKYIATDGHKCDSLAEKIIDDWLYARKIQHTRNVRYANTRYTADFVVKKSFIEFFGLRGQLRSYDSHMKKKLKIIKENNIKLISIYPEDLFPTSKLDEVLKKSKLL